MDLSKSAVKTVQSVVMCNSAKDKVVLGPAELSLSHELQYFPWQKKG